MAEDEKEQKNMTGTITISTWHEDTQTYTYEVVEYELTPFNHAKEVSK